MSCRTLPRVKASGSRIVPSPLVSFDRHVNRRDRSPAYANQFRHDILARICPRFLFPGPRVSHGGRDSRGERSYFVIVLAVRLHRHRRRRRRSRSAVWRNAAHLSVRYPSSRLVWILTTRYRSVSRRNSAQGRRRFVTRANRHAPRGSTRTVVQGGCDASWRGTAILSFSRRGLESVGRCPRLLHALPRLCRSICAARTSPIAWELMLGERFRAPSSRLLHFPGSIRVQELPSAIAIPSRNLYFVRISRSLISFHLAWTVDNEIIPWRSFVRIRESPC